MREKFQFKATSYYAPLCRYGIVHRGLTHDSLSSYEGYHHQTCCSLSKPHWG